MQTIRTYISLSCRRFRVGPLRGVLAAVLALALPLQAAAEPAKRERLMLAGPAAAVSFPLLHMVESGALADVADKVEFTTWNNPDQLRALALEGQADFMAMPTNVAANLYNRGVPLRLVNVSVWGMLWMVSRNPGLKTLADFKGEEIAVPFRADMPDIVFGHLAERSGLDPRRDFTVRYTATPMDAMQLLVMRRVDHALLAEPAVSMALRKTQSFPTSVVAPDLYRSVNLQEEWGRLLNTAPRIPQAGMAAVGAARLDEALVARLEKAYAESNRWCLDNAQACAALAAKYISMLTPEAVADSIAVLPRHYATAAEAREELEAFLGLLLARQPATVGNKLPDAAFYGPAP
ncbi:ABC transporter substrate-binding protein [Alcaligenaceae bacterium]|nr:ABC transporter substrate-binding protein [Alcaligenaceae bacterium]